MKVLITTHQLYRGGKEKQLMVLASGLLERNIDVCILSTLPLDEQNFYDEFNFPTQRILSINDKNYITGFRKFKREVKALAPGIVITFDIQTSLWMIWLQQFIKIPFINHSIQRGTPYPRKEQKLLKYIAKRSSMNIANSSAGLKMLGLRKNKVNHIIYSPFEVVQSNNSIIDFYSIFNIEQPKNSLVIINVGSISDHKGQNTIVNTLIEMDDPLIFAIFVGEGSERKQLEDKVSKSGVAEQIHFTGRVNNVIDYLKISNVYVHASKGEGSSNAILEALYVGLPVISTLEGGTSEIAEVADINEFSYGNIQELRSQLIRMKSVRICPTLPQEFKKRYLNKSEYTDAFNQCINIHLAKMER